MKLLKKTSHQRYYELPFVITKYFGFGEIETIAELWNTNPILLKEPWKLAEDISRSINKICVSDAHTHFERLVFPAFHIRNKETDTLGLTHINEMIDGKMTIKINGGSSEDVHPDAVYIRHLRILNSIYQPITVCDKCSRACCWQGYFMCDGARDAGTMKKTRQELIELGLEHIDYMKTDEELCQK